MLRIYYEHCKDAEGNAYMELVCSSDGDTNFINWKTDGDTYNEVGKILKSIITTKRFFDAEFKTWTYTGGVGILVIQALEKLNNLFKSSSNLPQHFSLIEITALFARLQAGDLSRPVNQQVPKNAENFYYTPIPVKEVRNIKAELATCLQLSSSNDLANFDNSQLRKLYLRKAMEYHPDRNNGDGSKMSLLNELWQAYQKGE